MPKKTAKEPQNWKRIWQMIRPYRGWMIASMVLAAFTVAFTLYIPILVGNAIDAMVEAGKVSFAIITPILWKIAILAVLTALFQWIMQTMHNKITYQVVRDFRTAAFEKIQKLPLSYLDRHPTGETVSRVITDVDQFADGLLMGFTQLFTGVFTLIGTLLFMLVLWALPLDNVLRTGLSIIACCPAGSLAAVLAKQTGTEATLASQAVAHSTVCMLVTVPAMLLLTGAMFPM